MAYVTVPKDLTHVKSKVLFGLTKRQLVCFGGALLTGGPLYFLTRDYLSNSAAALLMIFAMLPGLLFALFERHGQPLEVVIQQMIQCCFIRPKERPMTLSCCGRLSAAISRKISCCCGCPGLLEHSASGNGMCCSKTPKPTTHGSSAANQTHDRILCLCGGADRRGQRNCARQSV